MFEMVQVNDDCKDDVSAEIYNLISNLPQCFLRSVCEQLDFNDTHSAAFATQAECELAFYTNSFSEFKDSQRIIGDIDNQCVQAIHSISTQLLSCLNEFKEEISVSDLIT